MMVLLITVFIMPIISIFLATLKCETSMTCDSIFYYILIVISAFGIVELIVLVVYFELFLVDFK